MGLKFSTIPNLFSIAHILIPIFACTFEKASIDNVSKIEIKNMEEYCYVTNSKRRGVNDKKMYFEKAITAKMPL
jgi:hypothetical protein